MPDAPATCSRADAIVIGDAGNFAVGVPTLTTTLRGIANLVVTRARRSRARCTRGCSAAPRPTRSSRLTRMLATLHDERGNVTRRRARGRRLGRRRVPAPSSSAPTRGCSTGSSSPATASVADMLWARPAVNVLGIDCPPVVGSTPSLQAERAGAGQRPRPGRASTPREARTPLAAHLEAAAPLGAQVEIERRATGRRRSPPAPTAPPTPAMSEAIAEAFGREPTTAGPGRLDPALQRARRDLPGGRDHPARRRGAALPASTHRTSRSTPARSSGSRSPRRSS